MHAGKRNAATVDISVFFELFSRLRCVQSGRRWNRDVPVIMVSSPETLIDRVRSFRARLRPTARDKVGHDELVARIRAG